MGGGVLYISQPRKRVNCSSPKKKRHLPGANAALPLVWISKLTAALTLLGCTATASAAGSEIHAGLQLESIHVKVDFNGLGFFQELFVDDILVSVHFVSLIRVIGLIQSHGQAGAPSATFV
jgi:hypothetical protein